MQPRIESPARLPGVMQALNRLAAPAREAGIPDATRQLVVLRASQINVWNRINVATHQITGDWVEQLISVPAAAGRRAA